MRTSVLQVSLLLVGAAFAFAGVSTPTAQAACTLVVAGTCGAGCGPTLAVNCGANACGVVVSSECVAGGTCLVTVTGLVLGNDCGGSCIVNVGDCHGSCEVNVGTCAAGGTDGPANCTVNVQLCSGNGDCTVNVQACNGDCFVNLGGCSTFGPGVCTINIGECFGDCNVNVDRCDQGESCLVHLFTCRGPPLLA